MMPWRSVFPCGFVAERVREQGSLWPKLEERLAAQVGQVLDSKLGKGTGAVERQPTIVPRAVAHPLDSEESFLAVNEHKAHLGPIFGAALVVLTEALGAPAPTPAERVACAVEGFVSGFVDFDSLSLVCGTTYLQVLVCFQDTTDGSELKFGDRARPSFTQ